MDAGMAATPNMTRHPPAVSISAKLTAYATTTPTVIPSSLSDTSCPRRVGGAISEIYTHSAIAESDTAYPTTTRAASSIARLVDIANQHADRMKRAAFAMMVFRRPIQSQMYPPVADASTAPTSSAETTASASVSLSSNSSTSWRSAPEITPMSYPNRNPPIAAVDAASLSVHVMGSAACREWERCGASTTLVGAGGAAAV
mmetsp:Transcript_35803/g.93700  ORF Transcript_35803/g.93700 Transcript_35803/m.93700 type:complete len:201 (+) Transcript_35803:1117-1719(+)